MDGLYLYCFTCHNYVGGGYCGCGWKNNYPDDRKSELDNVTTEDLITELSSRLFHVDPDDFEDVLDELRSNYVRD